MDSDACGFGAFYFTQQNTVIVRVVAIIIIIIITITIIIIS